MLDYIGADVRRVLHKRSFWGVLGAFAGLFGLLVFVYFSPAFTADQYVAKITSFLDFFPLIIGLFVFMSVYADDFKCKSMQVAIGYGMPRERFVLEKLLESALLVLGVTAVMGVLVSAAPVMLGLAPNARHLQRLVFSLAVEMLRAVGYTALATVPVFCTQNAVNGVIFYVLLASKTVYIALSLILGQEFLVNKVGDLTKYLYTRQLYNGLLVQSGTGLAGVLLAVMGYVVAPTVISILVFRKKELEF